MGTTDDCSSSGVVVVTSCVNSASDSGKKSSKGGTFKMKVLKKIKKRMGLASRSSSNGHGTNNLPPLLFHNVCGQNIRISRDGTIARRAESFCKGIAFSSRPVKVNEKICIKFLEISNNWSGVIRFGFSYNDPSTLRDGLPKYACPDLTNKPGYWAKALPERFCNQGTVLFYYVTPNGDVHFGVNNEERGVFFSGVETRGPLWALIDVYGNSTAIEFVDVRHQLNNARRSINGSTATIETQQQTSNQGDTSDRLICAQMQNISINHHREQQQQQQQQQIQIVAQQHVVPQDDGVMVHALRYQSAALHFTPMPLHRTRGRNIRFNGARSEASRLEDEFCQGYVFTGRPLQLGERIVIQILATNPMFQGCLGLGLTSCDPGTLLPSDLPDDSNFLLDRPEYWVISQDFARNLQVGDEIGFCIAGNGEVQISRNGGPPAVVIHVDQTLQLWAFFDVYGSTRRIRVLSTGPTTNQHTPTRHQTHRQSRIIASSVSVANNSESMNSLNSQSEQLMRRSSAAMVAAPVTTPSGATNRSMCCVTPADIQVQPSANGGAVLSVILPPGHASLIQQSTGSPYASQSTVHTSNHNVYNQQQQLQQQQQQLIVSPVSPIPSNLGGGCQASMAAAASSASQPSTGTMMSTCSSNTYIEPIASRDTLSAGSCAASVATLPPPAIYSGSSTATPTTPNKLTSSSWVTAAGQNVCSSSSSGNSASVSAALASSAGSALYGAGADCTICYEKPIDAVLYMCGHMCMCYECALQQWRGKGGGHCPLCRAVIRDVIRTYKS